MNCFSVIKEMKISHLETNIFFEIKQRILRTNLKFLPWDKIKNSCHTLIDKKDIKSSKQKTLCTGKKWSILSPTLCSGIGDKCSWNKCLPWDKKLSILSPSSVLALKINVLGTNSSSDNTNIFKKTEGHEVCIRPETVCRLRKRRYRKS